MPFYMDARSHQILRWGVLLTAIFAAVGTYAWTQGEERRALHRIGAEERAAICVKTFESFQGLCSAPISSALEERCRSQARFLSLFPECIGPCRETISRFITTPTR